MFRHKQSSESLLSYRLQYKQLQLPCQLQLYDPQVLIRSKEKHIRNLRESISDELCSLPLYMQDRAGSSFQVYGREHQSLRKWCNRIWSKLRMHSSRFLYKQPPEPCEILHRDRERLFRFLRRNDHKQSMCKLCNRRFRNQEQLQRICSRDQQARHRADRKFRKLLCLCRLLCRLRTGKEQCRKRRTCDSCLRLRKWKESHRKHRTCDHCFCLRTGKEQCRKRRT